MKVLTFPSTCATDLIGTLRLLADQIERGEYSEVTNLVWVMEHNGEVDLGMLGRAGEPGATAHLLLAIAQRKLEGVT